MVVIYARIYIFEVYNIHKLGVGVVFVHDWVWQVEVVDPGLIRPVFFFYCLFIFELGPRKTQTKGPNLNEMARMSFEF